jgi:hypothetical protein
MAFPYSLGLIVPGGTFATVSVPLTQNIVPVANDGTTPDYQFNAISIQAAPANTGVIYICNSAAAPDKVGYTNVIYILAKGLVWTRQKEWANNRDISKIFLGADNGTDFAIASIDAF